MRKLVLIPIVFALSACNKGENKTEEAAGGLLNTIENVKNTGKIASSIGDLQKNMEKLKTLTPATNDQLKQILPETLSGLKRKELSVGNMSVMQVSSAEARYSDDSGKHLSLNIIDGAGEAGGGVISVFALTLNADTEKTTDTGFEKTMKIGDSKAFVSQNKSGDQTNSSIKILAKGRYMIDLEGDGFTVEELEKILKEIDTSKLP